MIVYEKIGKVLKRKSRHPGKTPWFRITLESDYSGNSIRYDPDQEFWNKRLSEFDEDEGYYRHPQIGLSGTLQSSGIVNFWDIEISIKHCPNIAIPYPSAKRR